MVNISEANKDIKAIAARNNVAMFSVGDLFNDKINNHFHYDYQKVIDEVSRINGRDMTQELIDSDYLRPLPHGEYEINLQYDINTIGQRNKKVSLISAADNDLMTSYKEAAYILQDEHKLFQKDTLKNRYDKEMYIDRDIDDYQSFLKDLHAKSFSYAAMMLRSDNPQEFAKNALLAWKEGMSEAKGDDQNISHATFPVMAATLKNVLEICKSGQGKKFFTEDGRLDDKKLSHLCQDMVYQNAYSPEKFNDSFEKNLYAPDKQFDHVFEKARKKLLKCMAVLTPETDEYWNIKEMQRQLANKNRAVIEEVMKMPYERFLIKRNSLESMKKMEQPITQKYLNDSLFKTFDGEETKILIEAGADINARNEYGETPLMYTYSEEKTKALIEAGADVNVKDNFGKTALMRTFNVEQTKVLLEAGADINDRDKYGQTVLMHARNVEQTKFLLESGADINAKNKFGETALMLAHNVEQTKALIEAGADINDRDKFGHTTLMLANNVEQTKLLIDMGVDIHACDELGHNALMLAHTAEQSKLLIEKGIDVNYCNSQGVTALMWTYSAEQTKTLIDAGANINAKDISGKTALMWARSAEQAKALIEAGIDIHAKDNDGKNALYYANTVEQAKVLLEAGVELPETLDNHFTAENIEEIKTFALKQKKKREAQQSINRVKNLLNTKNMAKDEKQTPEMSTQNNKQAKNLINLNTIDYSAVR